MSRPENSGQVIKSYIILENIDLLNCIRIFRKSNRYELQQQIRIYVKLQKRV